MVTLGIETSCDETSAAVVENGRIRSNIVSSSVPLHEKFGGVIPEIASRFHIEYINQVTRKALKEARKKLSDLDVIAVTEFPGLPGSLIVGLSFAKSLSFSLGIPLLGINHIQAHLYANFVSGQAKSIKFPFIGVVVSGGHTNIFIARSFEDLEMIGRTKDDAMGEAFDKVAKILGIGYPGGPKIEKFAAKFKNKNPIKFPRSYLDAASFDFSFSGVKTAVLYHARRVKLSRGEISRVAWSFQEAVFDVLTDKIIKVSKKFGIKEILLGGGVISNKRIRSKLQVIAKRLGYRISYPPPALCVDNAAMVAGLGERLFKNGQPVKWLTG